MKRAIIILLSALSLCTLTAKSYIDTPLPTVIHEIEAAAGGALIINFVPADLASYRVTLRTAGLSPMQALRAAIEHAPVKMSVDGKYVTLQYAPSSVTGRVCDIKGLPVENVSVKAFAGSTRKYLGAAMTDSAGVFQIDVPYRGDVVLTADCLGYTPLTVAAETDNPAEIALSAEPTVLSGIRVDDKAVTLRPIEVNAAAIQNIRLPQTGRATVEGPKMLNAPMIFGEPDIVKSLQQQSGVSQGVEAFTGLYVHGGNNDQNMFVYEGLPLYHVGHLGGLFSAFNVNSVGKADFYKSYFPSRFGGRLSSVTDIGALEPDFRHYHGRLSLGLISGNAYITGPVKPGRTAFSVGIRRTWADVITAPAIAILNLTKKKDGVKSIAHYAFTDLNLRLDHRFSANLTGKIVGYYGHDAFKLGDKHFDPNHKSDYFDKSLDNFSWGNSGALASLEYATPCGPLGVAVYYSRYSSRYTQTEEKEADVATEDSYLLTESRTRNCVADIGARLYYDVRLGICRLRAGTEYIHHHFNPEEYTVRTVKEGAAQDIRSNTPEVDADEASVYLENEMKIGDHLVLNFGARYSAFLMHGATRGALEPRAAVNLIFSDNISVKAAYSRMSQYVQQIARNYISLPTDFYQPVPKGFKPLLSDHCSAGVYATLPGGWYGNVEGWYRTMDNVLEYRDGVSVFNEMAAWSDKLTSGRGWAYGADLSLTKSVGRVTGTLGYGLMWNWRRFEQLNHGRKFPAQFDNRHKINIAVEYALNDKIKFSAAWTYMTGNRITVSFYEYRGVAHQFPQSPYGDGPGVIVLPEQIVSYYSGRNNFRLPAYHRLDLDMTLTNKFKDGREGIWHFSLYNAYNHLNAMTIKKDAKMDYYTMGNGIPGQNLRSVFRTYSLLPILPSVSYTYVF